ncbi:MAG: hypothetical protein ACLUAO_00115 [Streptococcus sp.]
MIVVNKAEALLDLSLTNFKRDSFRNKIMNQAVPRELYAQGIYYVSSILGLGAKLNGHLEENLSEQFDTYREKYSNPETKYYKLHSLTFFQDKCLIQFEQLLKKFRPYLCK